MNSNILENNNLDNIYELNSVEEIYDNKINYNNMSIIPIEYFNNGYFYKFYNKFFDNEYNIKDFKILYDIIQSLNLTNFEKNLILVRFRRINLFCIDNFKSVSNYYEKSKIFIIICGILNPSLLSINNNQDHTNYTVLFWTVWTLQLLVSLITSFISFYKWDKKYFLYSSYKSKINQEIWLYLELTNRYSLDIIDNDIDNDSDDNKNHIHVTEPTHKNKLNLFLERIEYLFKKLKDCDLEIETNDEDKEIISNKIIKKKKKRTRHSLPEDTDISNSPENKNVSETPDDKDVSETPDDNNDDDNGENTDNNV